jgi:hypothetical protein
MPDTPQRELALAYYSAERAEVVQRLAMREQVLLASLTVSGVVAGLAYNGTPPRTQLLLLLPLFALPFALAHVRHTEIIRWLSEYLCDELNKYLVSTPRVYHWDESPKLGRQIKAYLIKETIMHIALICGPGLVAAIYLQFFNVAQPLSCAEEIAVWTCLALALFIMSRPAFKKHFVFGSWHRLPSPPVHPNTSIPQGPGIASTSLNTPTK